MYDKLLPKKSYKLRVKISKGHLKSMQNGYNKIIEKYGSDANKSALLGKGYLEHIEQLKKEIRFYEKTLDVLDKAKGVVQRKWFTTPNKSLKNKTPLEVISKEPAGSKKVINLIGMIEHGIYS